MLKERMLPEIIQTAGSVYIMCACVYVYTLKVVFKEAYMNTYKNKNQN